MDAADTSTGPDDGRERAHMGRPDETPGSPEAPSEGSVIDRGVTWVRDVGAEVAALPETLRAFREGVARFREVTERLETATEAIGRVNAHGENTGLYDAIRRLDATATALEREALAARERLPGRELVETAARDIQSALTALGGIVAGPVRAGRGRPPGPTQAAEPAEPVGSFEPAEPEKAEDPRRDPGPRR